MKTLVTGGAGFIGSHLVDALIAAGHSVVVVDWNDPTADQKNAKAEYIKTDIRDAGIQKVFMAAAPEIVFHLAAHIDDRASIIDPVNNAEHNILGSLNVFEAARVADVKKIIFASTGVTYGAAKGNTFTEETAPMPLTPYAVSKLTAENYLSFSEHQYGLPYVVLRLANVYGPRQDGSKECGAVAIFTSKLLKNEAPFMNGDGKTVRDYIYVADVVSAMMAAMESGAVGVYNCGTGVGTETHRLFELVVESLGSSIVPQSRPEVEDMVKRVILDNTKAKKDLSWEPKMKIEDGIRETVEWYKDRV